MQQVGSSITAIPKAIGASIASGASTVKGWVMEDHHSHVVTAAETDSSTASGSPKKIGPELYVATARLYEKDGNFVAAADQYQKALKVGPNDIVATLSYAHMLDRQNKLDQATELYLRAVKAHPHEAAAQNDLGLCYARRRMFNESAAALSKAVALQPDRELYRNNLASVLIEQNRPQDALKQLQAVQADSVAHYNIGFLLQTRGDDRLAAAYFKKASELDPTFAQAHDWEMRMVARISPAERGVPATRVAAAGSPPSDAAVLGGRYGAQQASAVAQPAPTSNGQLPAPYSQNVPQMADVRTLPPVQ